MTSVSIPIDEAFRFDLALAYLRRSDDEVLDLVDGMLHRRVLPTFPAPSLIEISASEAGGRTILHARCLKGPATGDEMRSLVDRIYLPPVDPQPSVLTENLGAFLHENLRGLPVVQALTPWEALVWAVIGQQINIAFAYRLKRAFVERFGASVRYQGSTFYAFPDPETVALLDHERDLRPLQFSRQKSRYVIAAAEAIVNGELDFEVIALLDDDAASEMLQQQIGIGRWTAEYILLRGFGRLDVIPAGDAALKAGVGKHLGLERSATEDEVRALAKSWIPRRGETAFMLWFARQTGLFNY